MSHSTPRDAVKFTSHKIRVMTIVTSKTRNTCCQSCHLKHSHAFVFHLMSNYAVPGNSYKSYWTVYAFKLPPGEPCNVRTEVDTGGGRPR